MFCVYVYSLHFILSRNSVCFFIFLLFFFSCQLPPRSTFLPRTPPFFYRPSLFSFVLSPLLSLSLHSCLVSLVSYLFPRLLLRLHSSLAVKIPSHFVLSTLTLLLRLKHSVSIRYPSSLPRRFSVSRPSMSQYSLLLPPVGVHP